MIMQAAPWCQRGFPGVQRAVLLSVSADGGCGWRGVGPFTRDVFGSV